MKPGLVVYMFIGAVWLCYTASTLVRLWNSGGTSVTQGGEPLTGIKETYLFAGLFWIQICQAVLWPGSCALFLIGKIVQAIDERDGDEP